MNRLLSYTTLNPPQQVSDEVASIVDIIKEDIFLGRLKPRERLTEVSLCEKMQVKRSQLRKALVELERLGLVIIELNKGASVRDFTFDEVEQIIQMRKLLEEQAARLVPMPAPAELISALTIIQKQHAAAISNEDPRSAYELNRKFHDTLYRSCGNKYLVELINYFASLIDIIKSYRMIDVKLVKRAPRLHLEIISALDNNDRDEFVHLCLDHIKSANDYYLGMQRWWAEAENMRNIAL